MNKFKNNNNDIISWLRKQRDGLIIGDYRNMLFLLYKSINDISQSNNGICFLSNLQNSFHNTLHFVSILEFCEDLESFGYIDIEDIEDDKKITILKSIDF